VELSYTLPQDSTLFLLFRERHLNTWFRKLDWIAQNGGMALLDTHPDYMSFSGSTRNGYEYPSDRYKEFLEYVRQKYAGQYWLATPREVAEWYRSSRRPSSASSTGEFRTNAAVHGKKVAVLLYSYYPSDPRPRRSAEALANAGMEVEMICLRQKNSEPKHEVINGVTVRRMPIRRRRDSKLTYLLQYGSFITLCTTILAYRSLWRRYDLIHVHNMPDVLVFSGLVPKLQGAQVILDLHDPMPELMMTIFGLQESSFGIQLLKYLEKASICFADQVLTVNLACKKIFAGRSCESEKIQVVMNAPDEGIFSFRDFRGSADRDPARPFVIMYHGSIVERHGLDLAVEAMQIVRKTIPDVELRIYGSATPFLESVVGFVRKKGLADVFRYLGSKSLDEIAKAIEDCDVGIIPNRRSVFTQINTPTRIFEYLVLGKPVIVPLAPGITDYFDKQELFFF
jgi:glycosyltransferase involved in cell wall biosynthesis